MLQPITTFTLHLSVLGGHKPESKHDKAYSEKDLRLSLNEAIIWPKRNGSNSRRRKKRNYLRGNYHYLSRIKYWMYGLRRESHDITTVPISHSHGLTTDFSRFLKSHTPKHFWCICRIRRFQVIMMTASVRVLRINYDNLWNSWIDAMTTCMIRRQLSPQMQRQNRKSRQSKFQLTTKKMELQNERKQCQFMAEQIL